MKQSFKEKIKNTFRFFFPLKYTCAICKREIFSGEYFCEDCKKKLSENNGAICNHCGRYVFNSEEYCFSCQGRETYFDRARSAYIYKDEIKKLILALKYGGKKYIATIFAEKLSMIYYQNFISCDFVTFTPMSLKRKRQRGYNQAELIASEFCKITGLKLEKSAVAKIKETDRQATIKDAKERRKNLQGSFKVTDKNLVKGKSIILIDDIMTTGTTCEVISEELKKAGASYIFVLTVASVSLGNEGKSNKN